MPFKTTVNWVFNDIHYLVIGSVDCKIGVFEQRVIKVYYVLKSPATKRLSYLFIAWLIVFDNSWRKTFLSHFGWYGETRCTSYDLKT